MYLTILFKSFLIGLSIAAPVGPIGILCIRRTLAHGRKAGFVSGLGAATADALYGTIAAFSLTVITYFLISHAVWLRLFGGLFLILLGVRTFLASPKDNSIKDVGNLNNQGLFSNYFSTFLLTISNPLTILSFIAIFAGYAPAGIHSHGLNAASLMVFGIFLGSVTWWLTLSYLANIFRKRISKATLIWINRFAGVVIFLFGITALVSLIDL